MSTEQANVFRTFGNENESVQEQIKDCASDESLRTKQILPRLLRRRNKRTCRLCLRMLASFVMLALMTEHVRGNERYERWQADKPYTLAGYGTHDYGGGGKLDIAYFLNSGLNTAHDQRNGGNSRRPMVEVSGLPLIYMAYADKIPDLEGFIADFEKARKHYKNIIGLQLGDEMKSIHGEPGLRHMRQIRDWIVNHPDPQIRNLFLFTCTPAGGKMGSSEHIRNYMNDTETLMRGTAGSPSPHRKSSVAIPVATKPNSQ